MYDPSLGRWLTEDPIGFAGGDENLYRYVGNDPVNMVDPSGLAARWHVLPGIISVPNMPGSIIFSQVHGSRLDIGAGRWAQPDFAGDGSGGVDPRNKKYPLGHAVSEITLCGKPGPGGVCNTPISDGTDDKNLAGALRASMFSFNPGSYKVKFDWKITATITPGSVGGSVGIRYTNNGKEQFVDFATDEEKKKGGRRDCCNFSGRNETTPVTRQWSGTVDSIVNAPKGWAEVVRLRPTLAGQGTGCVTLRMEIGIVSIEKVGK